MLEIAGWVGSILFALCGLPQAIACWRNGNSDGLDWTFLLAWFFGEVLTIIYVLPKMDMPLLFNYFLNLLFLFVMLWYKIFPRGKP